MRIVNRNQFSYYFGKETGEPFYIKSGEEFSVETRDCFEDKIKQPEDLENPEIFEFIMSNRNPITGPIFIEGSEPGDTLQIHIKDIALANRVLTLIGWDVEEDPHRIFPQKKALFYEVLDGKIAINKNISLAIDPLVGTIGVAPKGECIKSEKQGNFGGNMDCSEVKIGSTLWLPVFVEGGLLGLGDVHAIQADGEVGMPFEVSATVVLSVDLIKGRKKSMKWPRAESSDNISTIVSDKTFEKAAFEAHREMMHWLQEDYRWNNEDIFTLLNMVAHPRVCQFVCPSVTVRCSLSKKYLPQI